MAWPKGKPRKGAEIVSRETIQEVLPAAQELPQDVPLYPADWRPGMLLNVRNTGADYTITLHPEEADPRKPERALHFTNPAECQNFVSMWYSRMSHDPRAG